MRRGALNLSGSVGFAGATPSLTLDADLAMSIAGIKRLWPSALAPGARHWFIENVTEGEVPSARFRVAAPAGLLFADDDQLGAIPSDVLSINFEFHDATIRTFGRLPPLSSASGVASLSGSTFGLSLDEANVVVPGGESVTVHTGTFSIENVFDRAPWAALEIGFAGRAADLGALADAEPIEALTSQGIEPDSLTGSGKASVALRLPLDEGGEDKAEWSVLAEGSSLGSSTPIAGHRVENAEIVIEANLSVLSIKGTADLDGVPAEIAFNKALGGNGRGDRQLARFHLDDIARQQLGLSFEQFVDGVVGAQISSLDDANGQRFDVDLFDARLTVSGLGWEKPAGEPGSLSFDLIAGENGSSVENIIFEGGGAHIAGSAFLNSDGGLASLSFDRFELRPGDSLRVDILPTDRGYSIFAEGARFDLRGLVEEVTGLGGSRPMPDLSFAARIDQAPGYNGEVIADFRLDLESRGGSLMDANLTGAIAGAPLDFVLADGRSWQANTTDAGGVLRFLDIETRIAGGALDASAGRASPDGPFLGALKASDFSILEETEVIAAIARAPGYRNAAAGGLHVGSMTARFSLFEDVVTIDEAFIRGKSLGATFKGFVDLASDNLDISGTYLPLYGVNNAFGRVPVVGRLLGGKDEGLIGVTFRVEGNTDSPAVRINPLSAVAPGILRKIFAFH